VVGGAWWRGGGRRGAWGWGSPAVGKLDGAAERRPAEAWTAVGPGGGRPQGWGWPAGGMGAGAWGWAAAGGWGLGASQRGWGWAAGGDGRED
jgi:hypothetical protein